MSTKKNGKKRTMNMFTIKNNKKAYRHENNQYHFASSY